MAALLQRSGPTTPNSPAASRRATAPRSPRSTMFKGQPVSILRRSQSGEWARVISDTRNTGWMKVSALCG